MRSCIFLSVFILVCAVAYASQERLIGDLDGNGTVDLDDFFILASNFGKTGGEVFDAGSVKVDTVVVLDTLVVRDTLLTVVFRDTLTLVVRDTTFLVVNSAPVIETVYGSGIVYRNGRVYIDGRWYGGSEEPSITVESGGWQQPVELVQAICESVQKILSEPLVCALDSDIVVRHVEPEGPRVLYSRAPNGSYVIWLDTEDTNFKQNVFQFAHEYGHLMSNYYQTLSRQNKWFDESLSSMASLYVLRKIHEKILAGYYLNVYVPSTNTTWYLHNAMRHELLFYAEENIPGHRMEAARFKAWFRARRFELTQNPVNRGYNDMIAHNLIDIFETNPEAWNAVRFLNMQGPVSWDQNQDFETYLYGWYLRTPARWQKYVVELASRFGYFPASKPALALGTKGIQPWRGMGEPKGSSHPLTIEEIERGNTRRDGR